MQAQECFACNHRVNIMTCNLVVPAVYLGIRYQATFCDLLCLPVTSLRYHLNHDRCDTCLLDDLLQPELSRAEHVSHWSRR